MMPAPVFAGSLIDRLPVVRGRLSENADIGAKTWFRVGGPAEVLFRPADEGDLSDFLKNKPGDVPVTVIGVASNLLVRDGGVSGVVVRLGRGFSAITIDGETIEVGSGALDLNVALTAADAGLGGFEFLSGVPGTIGGALRMNAGAFGAEMKDVTVSARALDEKGTVHDLTLDNLGFSYRHAGVPEGWIFTAATLRGHRAKVDEIAQKMAEIRAFREESQPQRAQTGGSTFANPDGFKAWELIDQAGCRGLQRGGAMVSEKHCNFLLNVGDAAAADLEGLGEEVRRRVFEQSGVRLEWEIRRIGAPIATGKEMP